MNSRPLPSPASGFVFVCLAVFLFSFPYFAFTEDESGSVVLYDSSERAALKEKEKRQEEKEEQTLDDDAPSNVVFLGDVDAPLSVDEEDFDFALFDDESDDASAESSPKNLNQLVESESYDRAAQTDDCVDVLIDMRHAHDFSDYPLTVDDRFYHRLYSFHRAFEGLKARGVRVEKYDSQDPITPVTLAHCKALFMNLPSADKEPFLISEIYAIRDFIENGGSLFLITDHTNCYFHQSRLTPLFHELDIKPQHYGVCDKEQSLGSSGYGWIYVDKFDDHPVTKGLRQIAFQTGGGVDPRFAVAWSGASSWRDAPIMPIYGEADVAFFGNFTPDPDEPVGASGVVLAKEFQKGKIVVVADQNLFSPFFLHYLDVYRLWNNAFSWLLDRPELADVAQYIRSLKQDRLVVCWEELERDAPRFGDPDPKGYYNVYTALCRYYNVFCIANDDPELVPDLTIVLHGGTTYSPQAFDYAYKRLLEGKPLVVLDPDDDVLEDENTEIAALLKKLVDEANVGVKSSSANRKTPGKQFVERLELTNGGQITLARGRNSYDNNSIPQPEARLLFVQMENLKTLLGVVDSALDPGEKGDDSEKAQQQLEKAEE